MVANHAVTNYIEILVSISLEGWLFFLLLHPASEEEKQRKTAMLVFRTEKEKKRSYLKGV